MCEILVKAVDSVHFDPIKDVRGSYKRGDIVVIMPDGWTWGSDETLPPADGGKFVIIKIPGRDPTVANKYRGEDIDADRKILRRRKFRIVVSELSAAVRNQLNTTGTITVTWANIRNFVENKVDSTRETGVA